MGDDAMNGITGRPRAAFVVALISCAALALAPAAAGKKKRKLGPVVTATASLTLPAQTPGTVTATCPEGKKAVGGGFTVPRIQGGPRMNVWTSLRTGDRDWSVTAAPGLNSPAATVTAYAYCRRVKKPIVDALGVGLVPANTGVGTATATCPGAKQKLIAGGFESTFGPQFNHVALPQANHPSGNGWTVSAFNNSGGAKTLIAHAYCTKGVRAAEQVNAVQQTTVGPGSQLNAITPACEGKKRLSAGGFQISPNQNNNFVPVISDTRLDGETWLAQFVNAVGTSPATLVSHGICTR